MATLPHSRILPRVAINAIYDDTSLQSAKAVKTQKVQDRKQNLAIEAKHILAELENEGWILAFTDGSAKQHPKVGWVAVGNWEAKGFLPPNWAQTNNRAEFLAVITVFEHFVLQTVCLAVVLDSQYVYDGTWFGWRTAG